MQQQEFDTEGASAYLKQNGCPREPSTLAEKRSSGHKTGHTGPAYVKNGRRVIYRKEALDAYLLAQGIQPASNASSSQAKAERRILKRGDVERITSLSRSEIYRRMAAGTFPASVSLGGRAVGWASEAIDAWLDGLVQKGGAA